MEKICAVIVTFNPDKHIIKNVEILARQTFSICIVDNGSDVESQNYLLEAKDKFGAFIIYNNDNLGVATALNIGIKYAINLNFEWIATFDQDSTITDGYFYDMLNAYSQCPCKEKVAVISPIYFDKGANVKFAFGKPHNKNSLFVPIMSTMTSGNLLKTEVFPIVGLFEDELFIDYIDNEFCLRCNRNGFIVIEACNAVLYHRLGNSTRKKFLWKHPIVTNHSPLRRYYIARNRVIVYRKYILCYTKWVLRDIISFFTEIVKIFLFEDLVLAKMRYTFKGIFHGITGRLGKY